jgi:hypothetical protein
MKRFGLAWLLFTAACSNASGQPPPDYEGGPADVVLDYAGYQACFDPVGAFLPMNKACSTNADCTSAVLPFCCGNAHVIGVSKTAAPTVQACIAAWPGCPPTKPNCVVLSGTVAEDNAFVEASLPSVRCVDVDAGAPAEAGPRDAGDAASLDAGDAADAGDGTVATDGGSPADADAAPPPPARQCFTYVP